MSTASSTFTLLVQLFGTYKSADQVLDRVEMLVQKEDTDAKWYIHALHIGGVCPCRCMLQPVICSSPGSLLLPCLATKL